MTVPSINLLPDAAVITLDDGRHLVLRTSIQADEHMALVGQASRHLRSQENARAQELDEAAARAMNEQNEKPHKRWGRTLQMPIQKIDVTTDEVA